MKRPCAILFSLLCACLVSPAPAQPTAVAPREYKDVKAIPDTPALRYAQQLANLFPEGNLEKYRAFMQESFAPDCLKEVPMAEHEQVFQDLSRRARNIEVYGARTYTPPDPESRGVLVVRNTLLDS